MRLAGFRRHVGALPFPSIVELETVHDADVPDTERSAPRETSRMRPFLAAARGQSRKAVDQSNLPA